MQPQRNLLANCARRAYTAAAMKTCSKCQHANNDAVTDCELCGARLDTASASTAAVITPLDAGPLLLEVRAALASQPSPPAQRALPSTGAYTVPPRVLDLGFTFARSGDQTVFPVQARSSYVPESLKGRQREAGSSLRTKAPRTVALVSINEDGTDGRRVILQKTPTVIGRMGDVGFPNDVFLSPQHTALEVDEDGVIARDMGSLNGTYIKLRGDIGLNPGDSFLMGRQVLRFDKNRRAQSTKARSGDGTRYMGSPPPGGPFKLVQIGIGGAIQETYCLGQRGAIIGRERGDVVFPRDKFMSSRHAQIIPDANGDLRLSDLNSSNGTWLRLKKPRRLEANDFLFLGQQLFRVEV